MTPAYRFGSRFFDDPRYRGRSWADVEPEMRTHYLTEYPDTTWERVKDAVHYGWERGRLRRRAA